MIKKFILDSKAQGEMNTIYMILILGIVAIVVIAKLKPMFKGATKVGTTQEGVQAPQQTTN